MRPSTLRAGTRRSPLAVTQTQLVCDALQAEWAPLRVELIHYDTLGDKTHGALVPPPGGKGLFTAALEDALMSREIDIAVHSLKDLPTDSTPGIMVGAVHGRANPCDVLIPRESWTLETLPFGASVGTSSPRRAAQLKHARKDLMIAPMRGNVGTRLKKLRRGDVDAIVLAAAGLSRLGTWPAGAVLLDTNIMLPAPGQGALAVQCRADDDGIRSMLLPINCAATQVAVTAERSFLRALGGGCAAPIAALGNTQSDGSVDLQGVVCGARGDRMIRLRGQGANPVELGQRLADESLVRGADILMADA